LKQHEMEMKRDGNWDEIKSKMNTKWNNKGILFIVASRKCNVFSRTHCFLYVSEAFLGGGVRDKHKNYHGTILLLEENLKILNLR